MDARPPFDRPTAPRRSISSVSPAVHLRRVGSNVRQSKLAKMAGSGRAPVVHPADDRQIHFFFKNQISPQIGPLDLAAHFSAFVGREFVTMMQLRARSRSFPDSTRSDQRHSPRQYVPCEPLIRRVSPDWQTAIGTFAPSEFGGRRTRSTQSAMSIAAKRCPHARHKIAALELLHLRRAGGMIGTDRVDHAASQSVPEQSTMRPFESARRTCTGLHHREFAPR